jgi:hypothetical protein
VHHDHPAGDDAEHVPCGTPPEESSSPEAIANNLDRLKGKILQADPA